MSPITLRPAETCLAQAALHVQGKLQTAVNNSGAGTTVHPQFGFPTLFIWVGGASGVVGNVGKAPSRDSVTRKRPHKATS